MKMKICYIGSLGSMHTERWMSYFSEAGHEVHLITSGELSAVGIENVKLHSLKRFGPRIRIINYLINSLPLVIQFKRLVKDINPDIIHAHYIMDITLLGAISGFRPFIVTPWGSDVLIAPKKSKILWWVVKYTLKKADCITCDAEHVREALIELGAEPQKIYRIYWGTDTRKFNPGMRSEKLRKELGIFDSPMIISSRRLKPLYDVGSLITAIPMVLKEVPEAKFVIAGTGTQDAELKGLAKSLGVWDSIRFVGGIPSDEFPKYLASADIYVCTSLSDGGLAISTKEAMACELPVIVTDFGDNVKWIENGANGFAIPLKDPKSLAEKIIYLIEHGDVRMKFGELGRKLVKERFEYDKELKKVENIYEQLISEHKK